MPDPSAGEIGGIFAGIVALLIAVGKGVGWLINLDDRRQSTRHAKLDAWQRELEAREDRIDRQREDYQDKIEEQLAALTRWAAQLQNELAATRDGMTLVATALRVIDPRNPALGRADELLRSAIPLDPSIPPSLAILLNRIPGDEPKPG